MASFPENNYPKMRKMAALTGFVTSFLPSNQIQMIEWYIPFERGRKTALNRGVALATKDYYCNSRSGDNHIHTLHSTPYVTLAVFSGKTREKIDRGRKMYNFRKDITKMFGLVGE